MASAGCSSARRNERKARFEAPAEVPPPREADAPRTAHPERLVVKDLDATRLRFFTRKITSGAGLNDAAQKVFADIYGEGAYELALSRREMPAAGEDSLISTQVDHKSHECSPSTKTSPPSPE